MPRGMLAAMAVLVLVPAPAILGAAPPEKSTAVQRLQPVLMPTDDLKVYSKAEPPAPAPAAPGGPRIGVDEKTKTLRVPVTFTRAKGVVEWLLAASGKHPAASVLVTACSARDVAAALEKIGLASGTRPVPVGPDRARPPSGLALDLTVVIKEAGGKETRRAASGFLAARSDGRPLGDGAWVYAGPQVLREADADLHVADLSGTVVTTNLRDTSGMIYWVPKGEADAAPYVQAYYVSSEPLPPPDATCELEIRQAPPPAAPAK